LVICKPVNYIQVRSIISKSPSIKLSKIKRRPADSRVRIPRTTLWADSAAGTDFVNDN
jgi:hypothetical protein